MVTYANPKYLKYLILALNSLLFTLYTFLLFYATIHTIGFQSPPELDSDESEEGLDSDSDESVEIGLIDYTTYDNSADAPFPSANSSLVLVILCLLGCLNSAVAIAATEGETGTENVRLLRCYAYLTLLTFLARFVFILTSVKYYGPSGLGRIPLTAAITSLVDLPLGLASLHLAHLLKLGDAATNVLPKYDRLVLSS